MVSIVVTSSGVTVRIVSANATELAYHFLKGRDTVRGLPYLLGAAEHALQRSAHREAIAAARRGLDLIRNLPQDPSTHVLELRFQAVLAPALVSVEGFCSRDAELAYARAADLGSRLGQTGLLFPLMFGQAAMHELRGEFDKSEQVLNRRLELLKDSSDTSVTVTSDALMACSLFHQGQFARALGHADRGSSTYNPTEHLSLIAPYGETPGPSCHEWGSLATWFLGYPDRALQRIGNALEQARSPDHSFSLASVLVRAALLRQLRREPEPLLNVTAKAGEMAEAHGYGWIRATAVALAGWAKATEGDFSDLHRGLEMLAEMGAHLDRPYFLALLAETLAAQGATADAEAAIAEAFRYVGQSRSHFYEAELHRIRGWMLLESGINSRLDEAEAHLRQGLRIAREQQARSFELRGLMDLCLLCRRRGRIDESVSELAALYRRFDEGFDTPDLQRARTVLDEFDAGGERFAATVH